MKKYVGTPACVISVLLYTGYENTGTLIATPWYEFPVRQCMLNILKGEHCFRGHSCLYFVYMLNICNHSIIIGLNSMTFHFFRPYIIHVVTLVFKFLQIKIMSC